jgi:predicted nucleic acid-binding protein
MKVLIDTNVILDVLTGREPFVETSAAFLKLCGTRLTGCISASQATDIFYILTKYGQDSAAAREILRELIEHVSVVNTTASDIRSALDMEMPDYEDAVLAGIASRLKMTFIITRNIDDFRLSSVPAVTPQAFMDQLIKR